MEKNTNFDLLIDRHHTNSLKYDFTAENGKPRNVLPMWVADMDFMTSSYIIEALEKRVEHGIYGYSEPEQSYFEAVSDWMKTRHAWDIKPEWLVKTPGVVFALAMAVKAFTSVGDCVIIQQPVYYPFTNVVVENGRKVVSSDLVETSEGSYTIDFADFEQKIVKNNVKLFLLCNPHNPVGRVWKREELLRLGEICLKHGVKVVSDEIHHDFIFAGYEHHVFASIGENFAQNCVICTSPGKTFNLAGLQVSNIFIPNEEMRQAFLKQMSGVGYSELNAMALTACEAAYRYGGEWYEAMMKYVQRNVAFVKEFTQERLSPVRFMQTQGTYLLWLDFRALKLTEEGREDLLLNRAGLWLDSGAIFGEAGKGFERFNIACPLSVVQTAFEKLEKALKK